MKPPHSKRIAKLHAHVVNTAYAHRTSTFVRQPCIRLLYGGEFYCGEFYGGKFFSGEFFSGEPCVEGFCGSDHCIVNCMVNCTVNCIVIRAIERLRSPSKSYEATKLRSREFHTDACPNSRFARPVDLAGILFNKAAHGGKRNSQPSPCFSATVI